MAPIRVARHTLDGLPQRQARRCRWNPSPAQFGTQRITAATHHAGDEIGAQPRPRYLKMAPTALIRRNQRTSSVPVAGRTAVMHGRRRSVLASESRAYRRLTAVSRVSAARYLPVEPKAGRGSSRRRARTAGSERYSDHVPAARSLTCGFGAQQDRFPDRGQRERLYGHFTARPSTRSPTALTSTYSVRDGVPGRRRPLYVHGLLGRTRAISRTAADGTERAVAASSSRPAVDLRLQQKRTAASVSGLSIGPLCRHSFRLLRRPWEP